MALTRSSVAILRRFASATLTSSARATAAAPVQQSLAAAQSKNTRPTQRVRFPEPVYEIDREQLAEELAAQKKTLSLFRRAETPEPVYQQVVTGYEVFHDSTPFQCRIRDSPNGGVLDGIDIAYETWGQLNAKRDNAILLHTGLSGSSHAHSTSKNPREGWWEHFIGPGKALDTNRYFVVCSNHLGGCFGTTGPWATNPATDEPFGASFPLITIEDMVRAQFRLLDHLGIEQLHASVGASMGGMQSVLAAALFPHRVQRVVSISAACRAHPTAIALRYLQRRAIMADPHWNGGDYYASAFPAVGMKLAREIATISYRSGPEWEMRFGRKRLAGGHSFEPDYLIETYLDYQGKQACLRFDPNTMIYVSKAMDMFDMAEGFPSLKESLGRVTCPTLVIGVQSDLLFPIEQQREMSDMLRRAGNKHVTYYELNSIYGHDTFLIDVGPVGSAVKGHLENSQTVSWNFDNAPFSSSELII
eukprot:m.30725 g.30725  ORF g.30725 m.30725 type:complete len:475 (+) comp5254_c0_seq1:149-1573(+)